MQNAQFGVYTNLYTKRGHGCGILWDFMILSIFVKCTFSTIWDFMVLSEMVGRASIISAINLENQGFTKFVHENVHKTPNFNTILGVFFFRLFLFLPHLND